MDDESGESMEPMEEVPLKGLGESEMERLVRGWRVLIPATLFNVDRSPRVRCAPLTRANCLHFAARRYMYICSAVCAVVLCPSVRPSVRRTQDCSVTKDRADNAARYPRDSEQNFAQCSTERDFDRRGLFMIRYDTRCYVNVRSKADMSQLNLPHGTDN